MCEAEFQRRPQWHEMTEGERREKKASVLGRAHWCGAIPCREHSDGERSYSCISCYFTDDMATFLQAFFELALPWLVPSADLKPRRRTLGAR